MDDHRPIPTSAEAANRLARMLPGQPFTTDDAMREAVRAAVTAAGTAGLTPSEAARSVMEAYFAAQLVVAGG